MNEQGVTNQSGFTLIEVLVAFTILSISLSALLTSFADQLRAVESKDLERSAVLIARSQIARFGRDVPLRVGTSSGTASPQFNWRSEVQIFDREAVNTDALTVAYSVGVTVTWLDRGTWRALTLRTVRLSPAAEHDG